MRPSILNPLFADTTTLPGVGPKLAALISKIAGSRVVDLLMCAPSGLIDRSLRPKTVHAQEGQLVTIEICVEKHVAPPKGMKKLPYKVFCVDDTGYIILLFFHARPDFLQRNLPIGARRIVSGKVERFNGELQMVHPDHIHDPTSGESLPLKEPIYPLTAGLAAKTMRKATTAALGSAPVLAEWLRDDVVTQEGWPDWHTAMHQLHTPQEKEDLNPQSVARQRLAYDELLANQLALSLIRSTRKAAPGRAFPKSQTLQHDILAALPFSLTDAQNQALREIGQDMTQHARMVRLLQGDVGAGKTIVALLAMAQAIESGAQAALLAPTEILARQHFDTMTPLCAQAGLTIELLTGRDSGKARMAKLSGLKKGYIHILVGTHALFSDDVAYCDLGFVVVDEQHRFGVHQRLAMQQKGKRADLLVMTATPIPRTLALASYGDMDISKLAGKPPGRKPVETRAVPASRINDIFDGVARALNRGEQIYWVCPLVTDSELLDLTAASVRYEELRTRFGQKTGIVHGQMPALEKDQTVDAFYKGEIQLLVATTVIEVGVNAPNATIIVIEHAERFGLAQLHQLRGRVGRSDKAATCLLLYHPNENGQLGKTAKARLKMLRETQDGFLIAEEDLRLRGAGDALGAAQSGFPQFRLADVMVHGALLKMAQDDARMIIAEDPKLQTERGEALLRLLYLFGRDDAVRLMRSG